MKSHRRWLVAALAFVVVASTGCSTLKGMGQDLQRAGQKIESAAKK